MRLITDDFLLQSDRGAPALSRDARSRSRFSTTTAICRRRTWPAIGASTTCSRSGSRAITTSGGPCAPTACPSATAPATRRPTRSSWRGRRPCRTACAIRCITGHILELQRYFGIDDLLDEQSAPAIWKAANERLRSDELTAHGILRTFDVRAVCTTDDPADPLDHHRAIAASGIPTKVYPTFRPDRALQVDDPAQFNAWVNRLSADGEAAHRGVRGLSPGSASTATRTSTTSAAVCPIMACRTATRHPAPTAKRPRSSIAPAPARPRRRRSTSSSPRT